MKTVEDVVPSNVLTCYASIVSFEAESGLPLSSRILGLMLFDREYSVVITKNQAGGGLTKECTSY
jgi:hypothetical protein